MLPILEKIIIKNFLPISSANIKLTNKNYCYQAGHGEGKTTLCDLIAFSLLRDNVHNRRKAYFHSRISGKDSNHIVKSVWKFSEKDKFAIEHKITKQMMFIRKNEENIDLKAYDSYMLDKTRLNLDELGYLFRFLYQITELDHHPFYQEKGFRTAVLDIFKRILVDEKANKRITFIKGEKKLLREEINTKKETIYDLLQSSRLLEKFPDKQKALKLKEEKLLEKTSIIDDATIQLEDAKKEEEKVHDHISKLKSNKYSTNSDKKKIEYNIKDLDKKKFSIETELTTYHNFYESTLSETEDNPLCKFCGNDIFENWKREKDGTCPLCGLKMSQHLIATDKRKEISELRKKELLKNKLKIEIEIAKQSAKVRNLSDEIFSFEKTIKKKEKERKDYRNIQQLNNRTIQKESEELGKIKKELELIKSYLSIDVEEKYQELNSELNEFDHNFEKLNDELKSLEIETDHLTDFLDAVELRWEELFQKYLGETVSLNLREGSISFNDHKRYLENVSGAESHSSSLLLKIALWEKLIKFGKAIQGLIIIDSPNVYSNESINKLWEIINGENSRKIKYIITMPKDITVKSNFEKINIGVNKTLDAFFTKL